MVDPIEYVLQNISSPKLDVTTMIISVVGLVLFILWTITYFFRNEKLQMTLFDIHQKLKLFIEQKNIHEM